MPSPDNPYARDSFKLHPYQHACHAPGCELPITEGRLLCELHGSRHRDRSDGDD